MKALMILLAVALGAAGCVTGAHVDDRHKELTKFLLDIEAPAMICTPKELALARANLDFAVYEAEQGQTMRASDHLSEAEENARAAYSGSRGPECEGDRDLDGIRDSADACPLDPEDFDGDRDEDGCPEYDKDGDGIDDERDACPEIPEDKDGFQDEDGCPEDDNDQDGIKDNIDQCPMKPEDKDGFEDLDGCPDPDNDQDGIPDTIDQCPLEPEDIDGDKDEDGCPDVVEYKNIVVTDTRIELKQKIFFAYNRARILPRSFSLLDEVADALKSKKKIKVRVEGHTDVRGSARYNKRLSDKRAKAVRTYLMEAGVEGYRMKAVGYGEEKLLDKDNPRSDRNRRVEFHILKE